jgi:hypothetical protein
MQFVSSLPETGVQRSKAVEVQSNLARIDDTCKSLNVTPTPTKPSAHQRADSTFPNDHAAYDFFIAEGFTDYEAAGIVGNLDQESGDSPTAVQSPPCPCGEGVAQWTIGARWNVEQDNNMVWYATTLPGSPSPKTLSPQLHFIWYELKTFPNYGLSALQSSENVTNATITFETDFEGCGDCDQGNRIEYAEAVLSAFGGIQSFTASSSSLPWFGGRVQLHAAADDASSYLFSSSIAGVTGLASSTTGADTITIPPNTSTATITYILTVTATVPGVVAIAKRTLIVLYDAGTNLLANADFTQGIARWAETRGTNFAAYSGQSRLPVGTTLLQANEGISSSSSVFQDVPATVTADHSYDASIWVRAATGRTVTGDLALWGLGGSNQNGNTGFTVGSTWTEVGVAFDATSSHDDLRLQIYLASGNQYDFVDAQLNSQLLSNADFTQGVARWAETRGTNFAAYSGQSRLPVGTTLLQANEGISSLPSVFQDVPATVTAGHSYDASIWVRAATGRTVTGDLALWGLGGSNQNRNIGFTVGSTWTEIGVGFYATSSHDDLRLQIYLDSGNQYDFVDAQLK